VFIEPICISAIKQAAKKFESSELAERLGRYHRDPHKTFYGWADVWRDRQFKSWDLREDYLPKVTAPVLAIQGYEDEYGTMAQLDEIAARVAGRCQLVKLHGCGHSPFRERPDETLAAIASFVDGLS
jgi:pimeloyl-ACP methyl ester carboxylesterase